MSFRRTRADISLFSHTQDDLCTYLVFEAVKRSPQFSLSSAFAVAFAQVSSWVSYLQRLLAWADFPIVSVEKILSVISCTAPTSSEWVIDYFIIPKTRISRGRPQKRSAVIMVGGSR
jgi:hypothetical protein